MHLTAHTISVRNDIESPQPRAKRSRLGGSKGFALTAAFLLAGATASVYAEPDSPQRDARATAEGESEDYFREVAMEDLNASSRTSMYVRSLLSGPAGQCGLREDDQILALNGHRIYSRWEYDFFRNQRDRGSDFRLDLIINRRGHLLSLTAGPAMPVRKIGFDEGEQLTYFDYYLRNLGVEVPPEVAASLRRIPVRANYAIEDWLKKEPDGIHSLEWLQEFVELRLLLANQEWDQVESPQHEIPVPYFQKLTDFYLSVAERNRDGEQIPDPKAHNVSLDYYVFHYPFPRFAPPLGELAFSDKFFLNLVKQRHADTTRTEPIDQFTGNDIDTQSLASEHIWFAQRVLVRPEQHSADLFRYRGQNDDGVLSDGVRPHHIEELRRLIALQDENETLYSFALAPLYALDGNSKELVSLAERTRSLSPYMAFRSVGWAREVWQRRHGTTRQKDLEILLSYLREHPFQVTPKKSEFYDFVMPRSRFLMNNPQNFVGEPTQSGMIYHPVTFSHTFGRPNTIHEEADLLNAAIDSPNFADHRAELLQRVERLAIPTASADDLSRLSRLGRDGLGRGLILDSFIEIAYSDFLSNQADPAFRDAMVDQLMRQVMWPRTDQYDRGYAYVYQLTSSLDDDDPEANRDKLLEAYADHGDVASTCLIAAELDKYGFADEATEMRGKVDRFVYAVLSRTRSLRGQMAHSFVDIAQLCGHDETLKMHRGINVMVRYYLDLPDIPHEIPAYLMAARYEIGRGKLERATRFLLESFTAAPTVRSQPLYLFEGQVSKSDGAYRAWLLRRLVKHEAFNDELRQKLAASPIPKAHPDVAEELGITADERRE